MLFLAILYRRNERRKRTGSRLTAGSLFFLTGELLREGDENVRMEGITGKGAGVWIFMR